MGKLVHGGAVEKNPVFLPDKKSVSWAKKCLVCYVNKEWKAEELVEFLQAKGYVKTRVCRLSCDSWILDPETIDERNNLLNENEEWLKLCFMSVRRD